MPLKPFVDTHVHSHFSLLDGVSSPTDNVKRAKALGMPAIAVSDHGTVAGIYEHYNAAKKEGLIPLIGNELYFKERLRDGDKERKYFHGVFLAMNDVGYKNLLWLSSIGFRADHYEFGRPIVSVEEILSHSEGLVYSTGCMIGIIGVSQKRQLSFEESEALFVRFKEAFQDRMFVEIGPAQVCTDWEKVDEETKRYEFVEREHKDLVGEDDFHIWTNCLQVEHNLRAIRLAKKHGVPTIVASDAHMADPGLKHVQDMLISGASSNRFHFHQIHAMLSSDETWDMVQRNHPYIDLPAFEGMIDSTYKIVDACKNLKLNFSPLVPQFGLERHPLWRQGMTPKQLMFEIIKANGRMPDSEVYRDRLKEEVRVICDNGVCDYTDYFLILSDIVREAHVRGVGVGPARGSAGGCLLSYLLGITAIDPIKWNLNFTRFLNEGRLKAGSPPDIDLDFSKRDPLVDYVFSTYGEDRTAMVGTFLNIKTKNALKDIARWKAGGHLSDEDPVHKVTATIKTAPALYGGNEKAFLQGFVDTAGNWHPGHLDDNKVLRTYLDDNPDVRDMLYRILEKPRSKGKHAGGVVITRGLIDEVIPTYYEKDGTRKVTQISHKELEKVGGMKIDLLGVNTLNWIKDTVDAVKERYGVELDPWNLPEEEKCFEPLWDGRADTIFQFDTNLVVPFLKRIRPRSIHALNLITAICRPGGLDSELEDGITVAEHFVKRYIGKEPVSYLDPLVEPILKDTYGLVVFQEQIQKIFEVVAGMDPVESDNARRAVGKKDLKLINSMLPKFKEVAGTLHGWSPEKAQALWDSFIGAANYSFNRAHSCAYAIIAYACVYLKYHYPLEWWASVLTNSDTEDIKRYLGVVRDQVRMPHVNAASKRWDIRDGKLIAPMSLVRGMGPKAIEVLDLEHKANGDFASFDDFYRRAQGRTLHKGIITNMCLAGCFSGLPLHDGGLPETSSEKFLIRLHELRKEALPDRFLKASRAQVIRMKMEVLPIYTCDFSREFDDRLRMESVYTRRKGITSVDGRPIISDFSKFSSVSKVYGGEVAIVCMVTEKKWFYFTSKKGKDEGKKVGALRVNVVNDGRLTEFVVWPSQLKKVDPTQLKEGAVLLAHGLLKYSAFKGAVQFDLNGFKLLEA